MNEETSKESGFLQARPEALGPQHPAQNLGDVGHSSRASRQFTTVVIDEEPQVAPEPGKPDKPKRRRGRPPGAKTQVAHEHVTADEFAVLRAVAQGMDIAAAARQFLRWPGRAPERPDLLQIYSELLSRVEAGAQAFLDSKRARRMVRDLLNHQTVVPEATVPVAAGSAEAHPSAHVDEDAPLPVIPPSPLNLPRKPSRLTLEEFSAQFDEDMYSEAELIELYEEAYSDEREASVSEAVPQSLVELDIEQLLSAEPTPTPSHDSGVAAGETANQAVFAEALAAKSLSQRVEIQLAAIKWLEERLGKRPVRNHQVSQWVKLDSAQRQALREVGVVSLGDLVDWMSLQGERWVKKLPGYGVSRGRSLVQWLSRWPIEPRQGLKPLPFLQGKSTQSTGRALSAVAGTEIGAGGGLAPLMAMDWPVSLNGASGEFRSPSANSLSAHNDQEAVHAWFRLLKDKSPHTQAAYRRAIERLILWAVHERGLALSSLTELDMQDFKEFLCHPPLHWVQEPKADRGREARTWRPLKGPLNQVSLNVTFAAVSAMYAHWMESRYTTLNPARKLIGKRTDELSMDVRRSFTDQDREVITRTFGKMSDTPAKRRLRAILLLLEMGGLRREEACKATWGQVQPVRIDGRLTNDMCIEVVGKGNRQRFVPLHDDVVEALREHMKDRKALMEQRKMLQFKSIPDNEQPLLGVLDDRWILAQDKQLARRRVSDAPDILPMDARGVPKFTVNKNGSLSVQSIYQILKDFFSDCSEMAGESVTDKRAIFRRASTHWLRHTFAHHLLKETDRDLALVQTVLGHKSITTTAIYVKADLEERVKGVKKLRGSV
ncbi:tyrosine-type recombinase/integrase [Curvibacter lanceolatus]|jgi:site-specific recombinase XerD|uniref:tyrosine-type recombinase/integrase n=1 Tax=Curvibacter lanceolatus TaxID=86182 RepID=UPI0003613397|nr:tyrosine-type recombinase/integrase [Curvibacter lanceolatus]